MAFGKLTIDDLRVKGRRVLMRVDFNVPLDGGAVADTTRIEATLPSLATLADRGGRLVLMSHLGRPRGESNLELSLRPVALELEELLGRPVRFLENCIGTEVREAVDALGDGGIILLENLRFHDGEEANDPGFAAELAQLGDVYVNDAFGTAHRAHASTAGVAVHFKECAAGYLMARELQYLGEALAEPGRPFYAILGGAKISGKIDVIESLKWKVDELFIGGGMAFTFMAARGFQVGRSLVDEDRIKMARALLEASRNGEGASIRLPIDVVTARELSEGIETFTVPADAVARDMAGYDIGPKTLESWRDILAGAGTIVWNGPVGVFEVKPFDSGTIELAEIIVEATEAGAISIIGGGDSAAAIARAGLEDRVTHVSTGGGASLEFLEGNELPGVAALTDKK
jgi:phosphoglycerate kinase